MTTHFLRSYSRLVVKTCHRRGAHAIGGMAAQIPIKGDEQANEAAIKKVRDDKTREATDGHDGTWVAHPALVPIVAEIFDQLLSGPHQIDHRMEDVSITSEDLLRIPRGTITETGLRTNINVGLTYVTAWLTGKGSVPIRHLMEDAATAEICRAQLWQWIHHADTTLNDGRSVTPELVQELLGEEIKAIKEGLGERNLDFFRHELACRLFERLVLDEEFVEFLTLPAYEIQTVEHTETAVNENESNSAGLWELNPRWQGIVRDYTLEDVLRLRGSLHVEHTLAVYYTHQQLQTTPYE